MNLVAPAPAAPSASDVAPAARGAGDPAAAAYASHVPHAADATDAGQAAPAPTTAPFGQVLSRQIDAARKGVRDPRDAAAVDVPDIADSAATSGAATKATTAAPDEKRAPTDDAPGNAPAATAASDLAAQLALVAQWAGVATAAAAGDGDAAATATSAAAAASAASASRSSSDSRGLAIENRRSDPPVGADRDPGAVTPEGAAATTATGITATQARAASFADVAAAVDAAAAKPGAAVVAPDAAGLLLAPDPTAAAARSAQLVAAATPTTVPVFDRLHEQVGTPAWSHEVGQAALRIAASDLQSASLRLNPEHLGPLDVQVRITDGVAHVAFQAAHADTRQALEGSRAALDQMFQGQGLKTGDVSVAAQGGGAFDMARFGARAGADPGHANGSGRSGGSQDGDSDDGLAVTTNVRLVRAAGLVDTFA